MADSTVERTSEEFDERQQELAQAEGEAYQRSLCHMVETVAHTGAMTRAGGVRHRRRPGLPTERSNPRRASSSHSGPLAGTGECVTTVSL